MIPIIDRKADVAGAARPARAPHGAARMTPVVDEKANVADAANPSRTRKEQHA